MSQRGTVGRVYEPRSRGGQFADAMADAKRALGRALQLLIFRGAGLVLAVGSLAAPEQAALSGLMGWASLLSAYSRRAVRALPDSSPAGDHRRAFDGYRAWRAARRAAGGRLQLSVE